MANRTVDITPNAFGVRDGRATAAPTDFNAAVGNSRTETDPLGYGVDGVTCGDGVGTLFAWPDLNGVLAAFNAVINEAGVTGFDSTNFNEVACAFVDAMLVLNNPNFFRLSAAPDPLVSNTITGGALPPGGAWNWFNGRLYEVILDRNTDELVWVQITGAEVDGTGLPTDLTTIASGGNFPVGPADGDYFRFNNTRTIYQWASARNAWQLVEISVNRDLCSLPLANANQIAGLTGAETVPICDAAADGMRIPLSVLRGNGILRDCVTEAEFITAGGTIPDHVVSTDLIVNPHPAPNTAVSQMTFSVPAGEVWVIKLPAGIGTGNSTPDERWVQFTGAGPHAITVQARAAGVALTYVDIFQQGGTAYNGEIIIPSNNQGGTVAGGIEQDPCFAPTRMVQNSQGGTTASMNVTFGPIFKL